jgi:hypothetical protein
MSTPAKALAIGVVILLGGATLWAQRGLGNGPATGDRGYEPIKPNPKYNGQFTFVRLRYGPKVAYASQRVMWSHDYPAGEQHFMKILNELSYLNPRTEETDILALDDAELFKHPVAYLCEPGSWTLSDQEATTFRAYLQKGGFLIVDDFRYYDWANFETNMRRIIPGAQFVDLEATNPIFHSFFEINDISNVPNYYDQRFGFNGGRPMFRGVFEDNDPTKRLLAIINYNTDISEFWEWSDTGFKPIDESNEAYKLGVNYIIYGMTH